MLTYWQTEQFFIFHLMFLMRSIIQYLAAIVLHFTAGRRK